MMEFKLHDLILTAKELGRLREVYSNSGDGNLPQDSQEINQKSFENDSELFGSLSLLMCQMSATRIASNIDKPFEQLGTMIDDLSQRMIDECSLRKFITLSVQDAAYVLPDRPLFGPEVEQRYPSAAFDIDEAGKCFGLSRPTAAVFHLLRVMEVAINASGACLGITPPVKDADRNWGRILDKIKAEIDRRNQANPKLWPIATDRAFFADAYASLDAVRVAWRNTTMHVENKYTHEEAEHIFVAVRGFMKKLASRCDENGEPKA